jgi:hypothetical protein
MRLPNVGPLIGCAEKSCWSESSKRSGARFRAKEIVVPDLDAV